jgi:hypothetical protein
MLLGLCLAMALGAMDPLRASGAGNDPAMLKRIASRVDGRTGVISIEASTPVPYIASQPDPNTFVIELRDVVALGFQNQFAADPRHPVASVQVENAQASDGAIVARVRLTLDHPMRPRVRSARNVIFVEADRVDSPPTAGAGVISLAGPAAAIRDVRVQRRGNATAVTLLGTSRLIATSIQEPKDGVRRVVVNLPNVTSAVPNTTAVKQGPVERVRIGIDPSAPLMTQVSVDLSRPAPYRVESSPDGNDLTLVFDEPAADPFSALKSSPAPTVRHTPDAGLGSVGPGVGVRPSPLGAGRMPVRESPPRRPPRLKPPPLPSPRLRRRRPLRSRPRVRPFLRRRRATPATRSVLIFRARIFAPCSGPFRRSAD